MSVVDAVGGHKEATLLEYLLYYCHLSEDTGGDGWAYRTYRQIEDDIRLTRTQQNVIRNKFKASNLLQERRDERTGNVHYLIDQCLLLNMIRGVQNGTSTSRSEHDHVPNGTSPYYIEKERYTGEKKGGGESKPKPSVGSRLPEDWFPSSAGLVFAGQEGLSNPTIQLEVDKFRDYWTAQPGQKGVKLDWNATWRNWVRNSKTFSKSGGSKSSVINQDRDERIKRMIKEMS